MLSIRHVFGCLFAYYDVLYYTWLIEDEMSLIVCDVMYYIKLGYIVLHNYMPWVAWDLVLTSYKWFEGILSYYVAMALSSTSLRWQKRIIICSSSGRKSYMRAPTKLASAVAYPFDFIKPCEVRGDVTLKDINQKIRTPPASNSKQGQDDTPPCYPTSAFSGKPVVGKTKIPTQGGKGSITIMRTKGWDGIGPFPHSSLSHGRFTSSYPTFWCHFLKLSQLYLWVHTCSAPKTCEWAGDYSSTDASGLNYLPNSILILPNSGV